MQKFNLHTGELDSVRDRPGFSCRSAQVGTILGGKHVGASLYELEPGQKSWPYHYEYGCEEWLLVVAGRPTLRDPEGEHELEPGDVVVFREGPEGAHLVENRTEEPTRFLILSTKSRPAVAVYPDSGKLGVWTADDQLVVRIADGVDYWEGE